MFCEIAIGVEDDLPGEAALGVDDDGSEEVGGGGRDILRDGDEGDHRGLLGIGETEGQGIGIGEFYFVAGEDQMGLDAEEGECGVVERLEPAYPRGRGVGQEAAATEPGEAEDALWEVQDGFLGDVYFAESKGLESHG